MPRRTTYTSCAALLLGTLASLAPADIIHVPGDQPTIAAAITAAASGDTIELAAGTFNEITLQVDKPLTIRGQGMDQTIIDARLTSWCMKVTTTGEFHLDKLTISNGGFADGAGLSLGSDTLATLTEVRFLGNQGYGGGALHRTGSTTDPATYLHINRCEFIDNHGQTGGALALIHDWMNVRVSETLFRNNSAGSGMAVYMTGNEDGLKRVQVDFVNCTFVEHPLSDSGYNSLQAASFAGATSRYSNCVFADNPARRLGNFFGATGSVTSSALQSDMVLDGVADDPSNVRADAIFEDAPGGNFRLAAGSPGIDMADFDAYLAATGGSLLDPGNEVRLVNDPRVTDTGTGAFTYLDAGVYESRGLTCLADINGDDAVNTLDILDFLNAWTYGCP